MSFLFGFGRGRRISAALVACVCLVVSAGLAAAAVEIVVRLPSENPAAGMVRVVGLSSDLLVRLDAQVLSGNELRSSVVRSFVESVVTYGHQPTRQTAKWIGCTTLNPQAYKKHNPRKREMVEIGRGVVEHESCGLGMGRVVDSYLKSQDSCVDGRKPGSNREEPAPLGGPGDQKSSSVSELTFRNPRSGGARGCASESLSRSAI